MEVKVKGVLFICHGCTLKGFGETGGGVFMFLGVPGEMYRNTPEEMPEGPKCPTCDQRMKILDSGTMSFVSEKETE